MALDERRGSPSLPLFLTVSFSLFIFSLDAGYAWQVLAPSRSPAPSFSLPSLPFPLSLSFLLLRLFLHSFIPLFSPGYSLEEEASTVQTGVRENKAGSLEEVKVALQL